MMKKYLAFISDLDGTLVDSEPQHADAWLEVLAGYGMTYDHHWFEKYIGTSDSFLAADVIKENQLSKTILELQSEKQLSYHEMMRQTGTLFPGVIAGLTKIQAEFPIAIGTNSGRLDADVVFEATGLTPFARISVTADDVANLKPAADIFLRAATLLTIDPANCIVCEDSPAGVQGANAAGCYVIGITSSQPAEKLALADEIVSTSAAALERVYQLLKQ